MNGIFILQNKIKNYDWGSALDIPELLGIDNSALKPCAELWMGVHTQAPSVTMLDGKTITLGELTGGDPLRYLGKETAEKYGALPFLFKLLAAEKPLSIQAHPNLAQAKEGFDRENNLHIPLDSAERNYKDPNHKPEILCALKPFKAMCGFRKPAEILDGFNAFFDNAPAGLREGLEPLVRPLAGAFGTAAHPDGSGGEKAAASAMSAALKAFLAALFAMSNDTRLELSQYLSAAPQLKAGAPWSNEWETAASFAAIHGADPAVIAPLYLNLLTLNPGEAVYLPAGVLHAYIKGFGVELMANSDNVLRGGLTNKHIDVKELTSVLDFSPFKPEILRSQKGTYQSPAGEFSLSVMQGQDRDGSWREAGPAIIIVSSGELRITRGGESEVLKKGMSAFIPAGSTELKLSGSYTLYAAAPGRTDKN
jgi:mannose-6-phosphate isomerase